MLYNVLLVAAALLVNITRCSVEMGSCRMSCDNGVKGHFSGLSHWTGLSTNSRPVGPPGKSGPKGENGVRGEKGEKGEMGDSCTCPQQESLVAEIESLRDELRRTHTPHNCSEVPVQRSAGGVFTIYPAPDLGLEVYCDTVTDGGGWIVFQRRMDGSENFFRDWEDYVKGFGNLKGEFWLGLDAIYKLMQTGKYELRVDMEDFDNDKRYAKYRTFSVGSPEEFYPINTTGHSGNVGSSLGLANVPFSAKDQDHDTCTCDCSGMYKGGWWYTKCHGANLNGLYLRGNHTSYADGVNWNSFRGYHYSLKFTEMKMRRTD